MLTVGGGSAKCAAAPMRFLDLPLSFSASKQPFDVPSGVDDPNHFNAIAQRIVENDVAVGREDAQSRSKILATLP